MEQRLSFDSVAAQYDRARPSYPDELFRDLPDLTGCRRGSLLLEIGAGTGKATKELLRLGYKVRGLEPGPSMAAIARSNCSGYSDFEIQECTFEDWKEPLERFDMVLSAQAFHWVTPALRFTKTARVLKDGGCLVVMANRPHSEESPVQRAIQAAYAELAPSLAEKTPVGKGSARPKELELDVAGSGLYEDVIYKDYPWTHQYSAQAWMELLATQSDHILLEERPRDRLLKAISTAIEQHGGYLTIDYSTVLVLGRKRRDSESALRSAGAGAPRAIELRPVLESDLPVFFENQQDPAANHMAAFTAKEPSNRELFDAHWKKLLADDSVVKRTILQEGKVVGHVASFLMRGRREMMYWIAREYWGRGVATEALSRFLREQKERPLYAGAAKDNVASIRVLRKCGFELCQESRGFSNARGLEIEEVLLKLEADGPR